MNSNNKIPHLHWLGKEDIQIIKNFWKKWEWENLLYLHFDLDNFDDNSKNWVFSVYLQWEWRDLCLSYNHNSWDETIWYFKSILQNYAIDWLWTVTYWRLLNLTDWDKENKKLEEERKNQELINSFNEEIEEIKEDIEEFNEEIEKIFQEKNDREKKIKNLYEKLDSKIENSSNPLSKLTYTLSKNITLKLLKEKNKEMFEDHELNKELKEEVKNFLDYTLPTNYWVEISEFDITYPKNKKFHYSISLKWKDVEYELTIKRTEEIEKDSNDHQYIKSLVKNATLESIEKFFK